MYGYPIIQMTFSSHQIILTQSPVLGLLFLAASITAALSLSPKRPSFVILTLRSKMSPTGLLMQKSVLSQGIQTIITHPLKRDCTEPTKMAQGGVSGDCRINFGETRKKWEKKMH